MNIRTMIVAAALAAGITGAVEPAHAAGRTTNQIAGFRVALHNSPALTLSTCVYGRVDGSRLVVSSIENLSSRAAGPFRLTLHDNAALIGQADFAALAAGEATSFARVVAGEAAQDDASRDNDSHASDVAAAQCTQADD